MGLDFIIKLNVILLTNLCVVWEFSMKKYQMERLQKTLTLLAVMFFTVGSAPLEAEAVSEGLSFSQTPPPGQVSPFIDDEGIWVLPERWQDSEQSLSSGVRDASTADNFGYLWDDSVSPAWIDATTGINTSLSGASGGQYHGPVELGFSFPYYENIYDELYIAASGFLTFTDSDSWPNQSQIPASGEPNNVIAPYWAPLYLSEGASPGSVHYLQGGEAPERFFVVEWDDVAGGSPGDPTGRDDRYHFQVILYESGDILFHYAQMTSVGNSYCASAGIEDAMGTDGLNYLPFCTPAPSDRAVLFSRPAPAARMRVSPTYQSSFISPGTSASLPLSVSNLGDLGEDTFELTADANWSLAFLAADGTTPLVDTNGDGTIDTGPLAQYETRQIFLEVTAPTGLSVGSGDSLALTVISSIAPDKSQTVELQLAVSSRFAQVFRDDANGAMSLLLAQPAGSEVIKTTGDAWWGYNPVITETREGNFLYLWQRWRYLDGSSILVAELEFTLLDYAGNLLKPVTRLVDHSAATFVTLDEEPVLTVAPDGSIGVAWRRRVMREGEENWNLYFAILNSEGELRHGPYNLTQNEDWYQSDPVSMGVPRFQSVHLEANQDNTFGLIWHRESTEDPAGPCTDNCTLDDIYYSIWNTDGQKIKPITRLTTDTPGMGEGYSSPAIQPLAGGRWLLVYSHLPGGMAFSVMDSEGNLIRGRSFIGRYGWSPAAAQLSESGRIMIAWTAWSDVNPQIYYVVLEDDTYASVSGPTVLTQPAATTGGDFASLTTDSMGHAILTWMDFSSISRHHLYYALLDENGALLTDPMIFYTAQNGADATGYVETGFSGYSLTSNRQFLDVAAAYWAAGSIERLYDAGITTGCELNPPRFCPEQSTTRAQMAVLLGRAIYGAADVPPVPEAPTFADVPVSYWAASWIEQLYKDGLTHGCETEPLRYCPENNVTRAEMAAFLVRALHGDTFVPPEPTGIFADVPATYWAAPWIEQLYHDGITNGCAVSPLRYCPEGSTTRAEISTFLVRSFDVP